MRSVDSNQALSQHLNRLLAGTDVARLELARRMGVADGTLGRIKYGRANPTIDVVDRIARYFRVEPWELLKPIGRDVGDEAGEYRVPPPELLAAISTMTPGQVSALTALVRAFATTSAAER